MSTDDQEIEEGSIIIPSKEFLRQERERRDFDKALAARQKGDKSSVLLGEPPYKSDPKNEAEREKVLAHLEREDLIGTLDMVTRPFVRLFEVKALEAERGDWSVRVGLPLTKNRQATWNLSEDDLPQPWKKTNTKAKDRPELTNLITKAMRILGFDSTTVEPPHDEKSDIKLDWNFKIDYNLAHDSINLQKVELVVAKAGEVVEKWNEKTAVFIDIRFIDGKIDELKFRGRRSINNLKEQKYYNGQEITDTYGGTILQDFYSPKENEAKINIKKHDRGAYLDELRVFNMQKDPKLETRVGDGRWSEYKPFLSEGDKYNKKGSVAFAQEVLSFIPTVDLRKAA